MATTWLRPLHVNKGKTLLKTLMGRTDYAENPDKTEDGVLVAGFACDPRTVSEEFMLDKKEYKYLTGRDQGKRDVIGYVIRQSFKPGEITPQEALDVGYETALRWTKGRYAFIVAVHTDKAHIHCHVVYNSTALDCRSKFKNFWRSSYALRRLSDLVCLEHGLSVIENPKPSKGRDYGEWLGDDKPLSWGEKIKRQVDEIIPNCAAFADFISALRSAGYTVKDNRKHISLLAPGQKRPIRLDTLKGDYTEERIRERIAEEGLVKTGSAGGGHDYEKPSGVGGDHSHEKTGDADEHHAYEKSSGTDGARAYEKPARRDVPAVPVPRVNLLIDIQAKIREGKGAGYEKWARIFNLREAAKTLVFLQEQGIDSYEDLKKKASSASGDFAALTKNIKDTETRLKEVTELQKYIGQYGKTRDVYAAYKAGGWSNEYYDEHAADIILHQAAKKYFDGLGVKKLPSINQLKQEWATLAAEKKKLYANYHALKQSSRALVVAKDNADRILGFTPDAQKREAERDNGRDNL